MYWLKNHLCKIAEIQLDQMQEAWGKWGDDPKSDTRINNRQSGRGLETEKAIETIQTIINKISKKIS